MVEVRDAQETSTQGGSGLRITRRGLFRGGLGLAVAGLVGREIRGIVESRFETSHAVFYPFYEEHGTGIYLDPTLLPETLDIHWDEYGLYPSIDEEFPQFSKPINEAWVKSYEFKNSKQAGQVAKDNLSYLKAQGVKAAFGDIEVYWEDGVVGYGVSLNNGAALGAGYIGLRGVLKAAGMVSKKKVSHIGNVLTGADRDHLTRRKFLFNAAKTIADLVAVGGILSKVSFEALNSSESKIERTSGEKALERVINRLFALSAHSRPQDLMVFFRNLIFAHKLLDLAEKESEILGRKVNISYQMGAAHTGMEDFLILGKGVCEKLLSCYSKEMWEDTINRNKGIDNVVSIIVLKGEGDGDGTELTDWQSQPTLMDEDLKDIITSKIVR